MREAVGGIVWPVVYKDVACLLLFSAGTLVLGLSLKKTLQRIGEKMKTKLSESRIIH
jgi:putative membrane protein